MKTTYNFAYWWTDGYDGDTSITSYPLTKKNFERLQEAYKKYGVDDLSKCEDIDDLYQKIFKSLLDVEADTYLEDESLLEELFDYDENIDYEIITRTKVRNKLKELYDYGIKFPTEITSN